MQKPQQITGTYEHIKYLIKLKNRGAKNRPGFRLIYYPSNYLIIASNFLYN